MTKPELPKNNYIPGQPIQDKSGTDFIITHVDKDGVDIKEIDNPQRIRRVGYDDLEENYTIVIHEQSPGVPSSGELIIYEDPKARNFIPKIRWTINRSVVREIFGN